MPYIWINKTGDTQMTHEELRKKARYGHRSYLYWTANGEFRWAPYSKAAIKAAILDVGVKGRLYWFDGAGNSHIARSFAMMIRIWRCADVTA